ncbi:MAG: hypothetical protein IPG45_28015 [Deltaproteobacteria bacterium]|nr:hypothetical protein [Deltaproteobacteria bacterium]
MDEELATLHASILRGTREYLEEEEAVPYEDEDVTSLSLILQDHVSALASATSEEDALAKLRNTVLRLNELNEKCNGELIETDQREDICAFLILAAVNRGFNAGRVDQTESWREW